MLSKGTVAVALAGVLVTGCASQKTWVYRSNEYGASIGAPPRKAVVLPYRDARSNENSNRILVYMIPIVPFGWTTQETPEGVNQHVTSGLWINYKPVEDYPKALVEDLRNSRLFSDAFFDFKEGDADYVIQGTIYSTRYTGKIFSYGLSVYGPLLWLVGLPAGSASNDLSVELTCVDRKSGRQVLSKRYDAPSYSATSFLYVMANDFNYPDMLASVNKRFVDDLRAALP
jgi:hypothetical protein